MVGGGERKINPGDEAFPFGLAMLILTAPDKLALATIAVMPAESMVKDFAFTSPKLTAVVPDKLLPVILTLVPTVPVLGVKLVILGPA